MFKPITTLEIVLSLIAFIVTSYLGLGVYLRNPRSWTHRFFVLLAIILDAYIAVNLLSLHPPLPTPASQLFWIRNVMFLAALISPTLFLLLHTFPRSEIRLRKGYLAAVFVLTAINAAMALTPLVFETVRYPRGEPVPVIGAGMPLFFLHFVGFIVLSFAVLLVKQFRSRGEERAKNSYLLFGVIVTFTMMSVFTIIFVVVLETSIGVFLGPIVPVILMASIAYAVVKHRFLDIRPVVARSVTYIFLVMAVALIYTGILLVSVFYISKAPLDIITLAAGVVLTTGIALTFPLLQALIRKLTDKLFFRGAYDPQKLLADLSRAMNATLDLDELTKKVLTLLAKEMRISKAAFLLADNHKIIDAKGVGYGEAGLRAFQDSPLELLFHRRSDSGPAAFIFQDLSDEALKNVFREYEIEVLMPIRAEEDDRAILVLGHKSSGDTYSKQDIKVLDALVPGVGIALQNARLYTDLQLASAAKSRFISVVSHQLRTPVSGMRWNLEMIRQEKLRPAQKRAFLDNAYQGAIFLGEQLDDILTALDIYDKKLTANKVLVDLPGIFGEVLEEFSGAIEAKQLAIDSDFNHDCKQILADPAKIKKVIKILVKNAVVYSPAKGKVTITAHAETALDQKKKIVVSVSDEGMGITEPERSHITEEFFRSDQARVMFPSGLGLGVFIAQAFVSAHGGTLWFYSEGRNKGADFHFSLPLD